MFQLNEISSRILFLLFDLEKIQKRYLKIIANKRGLEIK
jgi:hypothetical protein